VAIFLEVAVSVNIDKTYVYSYPKELEIGTRVEVSFGNQVLIGIVLSKIEKTKFDFEIKTDNKTFR
jgi:primosomal protein N'